MRFALSSFVLLATFLAGCTSTMPDGDYPTQSVEERRANDVQDDVGSAQTSVPPGPESSSDVPTVEPLSDFEDQLAGTWRRYHEKNSGEWNEYWYYDYIDFNEDRTACKWRYGYESSSDSDEGVFDEGDYTHWAITDELEGNSFLVVVDGRGLDYVFDFTKDQVYPSGFDTLVFYPNTDGKSCVARDGPSY